MSEKLSRRSVLASLPAAAIVTSTSLPALSQAPSEIEIAFRQYQRLTLIACDACIEADEIESSYVEPARPIWHPATSEGGYRLEHLPGNKCRAYLSDSDENIERLKELIRAPALPKDDWNAHTVEVRRRQARKSLQKIEDWKAEDQRRRDACGLTAALATRDAAMAAEDAQRELIQSMTAADIRELAFQAELVSHYDWDERQAIAILRRLVELSGIDAEARTNV